MYVKIPKNAIERIEIVKTDCKMTLAQVVAKYKPNYAINGGLYDMKTGKVNPIPLRIDGKTIATSQDGYWTMAWNTGADICMAHSKDMGAYKNAVACSAMLKDGNDVCFMYTAAQGGVRGRTGFGDDENSVHLFVTTDKSGAISPTGLRTAMKNSGCKNAIMLDAGGSSQMYANGTYVQGEKRKVAYWICIWTKPTTTSSKTSEPCPYIEPITTVRLGTKGTPAKWVQWQLNRVCNAGLEVDGSFGKLSVDALKDFQKTHALAVDGVCGAVTRTALKKA